MSRGFRGSSRECIGGGGAGEGARGKIVGEEELCLCVYVYSYIFGMHVYAFVPSVYVSPLHIFIIMS